MTNACASKKRKNFEFQPFRNHHELQLNMGGGKVKSIEIRKIAKWTEEAGMPVTYTQNESISFFLFHKSNNINDSNFSAGLFSVDDRHKNYNSL